MNYKLPVPDNMKNIGCPFEFSKLNDVNVDLKEFASKNSLQILKVFNPSIEELSINSANIESSISKCPRRRKILEYLNDPLSPYNRLETRRIIPQFHINNLEVARSNWLRKYKAFKIDSLIAIWDSHLLELSLDQAIIATAYNALLRSILLEVNKDFFNHIELKSEEIKALESEIEAVYQWEVDAQIPERISIRQIYNYKKRLIEKLRVKEFAYRKTVLVRAKLDLEKIHEFNPQCLLLKASPNNKCNCSIGSNYPYSRNYINSITSTEVKENVIRQILKSKSGEINKLKRSNNKGIYSKKKESFRNYITLNPEASNRDIAKAINIDVKTVRNYRKKYSIMIKETKENETETGQRTKTLLDILMEDPMANSDRPLPNSNAVSGERLTFNVNDLSGKTLLDILMEDPMANSDRPLPNSNAVSGERLTFNVNDLSGKTLLDILMEDPMANSDRPLPKRRKHQILNEDNKPQKATDKNSSILANSYNSLEQYEQDEHEAYSSGIDNRTAEQYEQDEHEAYSSGIDNRTAEQYEQDEHEAYSSGIDNRTAEQYEQDEHEAYSSGIDNRTAEQYEQDEHEAYSSGIDNRTAEQYEQDEHEAYSSGIDNRTAEQYEQDEHEASSPVIGNYI